MSIWTRSLRTMPLRELLYLEIDCQNDYLATIDTDPDEAEIAGFLITDIMTELRRRHVIS